MFKRPLVLTRKEPPHPPQKKNVFQAQGVYIWLDDELHIYRGKIQNCLSFVTCSPSKRVER